MIDECLPSAHDVLNQVADAVEAIRLDRPTRVGIDGRSAAGKTTFANALAETLRARGREVIRVELDDFHRPGHKWRSIRREWTAQSRYDESYDYQAFLDVVLAPLGPGGDGRVRRGLFDSFHDEPLPEARHHVGETAVAIVDGVYLLRPELAPHWDYVVWLEANESTTLARARAREVEWVGDVSEVENRYRQWELPSHALYTSRERPAERADIVIDANDWSNPRIVRIRGQRPLPRG